MKHQSPDFYKEWLYTLEKIQVKISCCRRILGSWRNRITRKYVEDTEGTMSLLMLLFIKTPHIASKSGDEYDLRTIFDNTFLKSNPTLAVTVVDNHFTQPLQALEAPVEPWFKTHCLCSNSSKSRRISLVCFIRIYSGSALYR